MTGLELTDFELKVIVTTAFALLVLGGSFLAFHRGRHVQSNHDRRISARARRRFTMAQTLEYGKTAVYRLRAFGQSGREMPTPASPTAVATPPEIAGLVVSPDGQLLHITNKNQTDIEVNVVVAVSAGGFTVSVNFVFRPEAVAALTLELVEEQPA
jgi:hypothetical protein